MPPPPPPPKLLDELIEEILLRIPPEDPAFLVRSSAVCKPWRLLFALPRFRRRYREFHGTPPLLGYFNYGTNFVPTSALIPAQPDRPGWTAVDCRHGRALLAPNHSDSWEPFDFIVVELLTGHQTSVPSPVRDGTMFSASVLCAAQDCSHSGCQREHFLVALVSTDWHRRVTKGWLYSSETRVWSEPTSLHHPNVICSSHYAAHSVLVGDALYFGIDAIIKCQLGTPLSFSLFQKPTAANGRLMTAGDGMLLFAAVLGVRNLTLWSMETGPEGAMGWANFRMINLEALLPDGLSTPTLEHGINRPPRAIVSGVAEGTQVVFVTTNVGCYMVDLHPVSGQVTRVSGGGENILPYMGFCIPARKAISTD